LTLGIEHQIETDEGEARILQELRACVKDIALADLVIGLLSLAATGERLPRKNFVSEFVSRVVSWVEDISS